MALTSIRAALIAAAVLGATAAVAQPGALGAAVGVKNGATAPSAAPAPAPAPQPIAVAQIFRAADELDDTLRTLDATAGVDAAIENVEPRLAAARRAIERLRPRLEAWRLEDASARELDRLRQDLAREALVLADLQALLEKRFTVVAGATREVQDRLSTWKLTEAAARADHAPAAVLRRVAQAEESLAASEHRLRERQDRLLDVQGRVSDLRAEFSRAVASLEQANAALDRQLFDLESAPLWRALARPDRTGALGAQLRQGARENARDISAFMADEPVRLWIHLGLVVVLGLGLVALRRPVGAMAERDAALRSANRMLARPWSAALLLSLPMASWIYGPVAPGVRDLAALLFLLPLVRLLSSVVPEVFRRPIYGLAALFALDRLASVAPPRTLLARLAVLFVTSCAIAGLATGLRPGGWARFERVGSWRVAARAAAVTALGLLLVSAASNVIGNFALAERLTHATLVSAIVGIVVLGLYEVLSGATSAVLHLPILQHRRIVARHRDLLLRRTAWLLRVAGLALWASMTVSAFGVEEGVKSAAAAVLGLRLEVGGLDVSAGNVVWFAVTLLAAVWLSRAVRFVLDEGVFTEMDLPRGIPAAISTTVQYFLIVVGFSWAVLASGMEMSRFSFAVGALGVGIGFGLQNVVNNFVSGLILLYERPIQVGDVVQVGTVTGEVTRIGVRSSTVKTFPGAEVIVPNATLIAAEVTNWTLSDRLRRIDVAVGVAFGSPPQRVIELLVAAVSGRDAVLAAPAPEALLLRFGESSMEFVLRFWTARSDAWQRLASDVMIEVDASLRREGIEIAFPQRDLHVRSLDATAARALAGALSDASDGSGVQPTVNRAVALQPGATRPEAKSRREKE